MNSRNQSRSPVHHLARSDEGPSRLPKDLRTSGCRFCGTPLEHVFVDLGMSPPCESYLEQSELDNEESFFPLRVFVCHECFLVQLREYLSPSEIFTEYAYFSSYSKSWLDHARAYVQMVMDRFDIASDNQVIELASNDGYLLQYFVEAGIPSLGVEPAANVAAAAIAKNIPTEIMFFGEGTAKDLLERHGPADLMVANNVLAQVPDLNDFVAGIGVLLGPEGVITVEFPHLLRLMRENQFDTIYHEHFSYFSLLTAKGIFKSHGLKIFDVEELPTHGGSLRIFAAHESSAIHQETDEIERILLEESQAGLERLESYGSFADNVHATKRRLLEFLIRAKDEGKTVAGYGAPGKGNTLLNYCGIRTDFVEFTVDRNPYKQGRFLPGTHIPIKPPDSIWTAKPDYLLVLPWNLKDEILEQMAGIREWGGKFVVPIPELRVYE